MKETINFTECNDNDVLSFQDTTFKVAKFRKAVNEAFNSDLGRKFTDELIQQGIYINPDQLHPEGLWATYKNWFQEGIDCEVLGPGFKSWKKGKVKIKIAIEFLLEEEGLENNSSESPLDEIRRKNKLGKTMNDS
ncbi:hypothetical protein NUACC21_67420 [Scytonema sp. NUACC21]